MKSAILFEYFLIVVLPPVILFGCSAGKENTRIKSMGNELSPLRHTLISEALRWEGVRYKYNGNDRRGIDCSGLVVRSFASANIPLPRTAAEQFLIGEKISLSHLIPGDLVFFKNTAGRGITHVGIYLGNNKFIHASTSKGVIQSQLTEEYYQKHFAGARRVLQE